MSEQSAHRRAQAICHQIQPPVGRSSTLQCETNLAAAKQSYDALTNLTDFPVQYPHATRFGDCDMYGHVNNVTFYSYFDTIVNSFLVEQAGMSTTDSIIGVVVASSCRYVASLSFPQKITLALRVKELGKSSVTYEIGVFITESQALAAIGTFTHVFVTKSNMRPTTIPEKIRNILENLQAKGKAVSSSSASVPPSNHPQSARRLLMVRPRHFQRNEETAEDNAFMQNTTLSPLEATQRATKEFDAYVELLRSRGIEVQVFQPDANTLAPDGCFPNNWFSSHARTADQPSRMILYPMKAVSRRLERDPALINQLRTSYESLIDLSTFEESNQIFEGTGSAIIDHANRTFYYCISERSMRSVADSVAKSIWPNSPYKTYAFDAFALNGIRHYHTNVMLCIGTTWAVLCTECMPKKHESDMVLRALSSTGREIILITAEQAENFCANILEVQNRKGEKFIIMSERAYHAFTEDQKKTMLQHVQEILHTPLETIEKIGGGGARCMIAELF